MHPHATFEGISPAVVTPEWVFELVACGVVVGGGVHAYVYAFLCPCVAFSNLTRCSQTVISVKL